MSPKMTVILGAQAIVLSSCAARLPITAPAAPPPSFNPLQVVACNAKAPKTAGGTGQPTRNEQAVLFVHGWNGDPDSTWQKFPGLVCEDPDFIGNTDVVSVHYPTFILSGNPTIVETASSLNDVLSANGLERYKRVAIISHSMGGLVGREMLIADYLRAPGSTAPYKILIEIATPHDGTTNLVGLASALGFPGTDVLSELKPHSPFLRDLTTEWRNFKTHPPTSCFFSGQDDIVPSSSAGSQCDEGHDYLEGGHRDLAKPASLDDTRYRLPIYAVKKAFAQENGAGKTPQPESQVH